MSEQPVSTVRQYLVSDIPVILGYVIVLDLVFVLFTPESIALRSLLGLPALFFLPGYVLLAALFPRTSPSTDHTAVSPFHDAGDGRGGLATGERLALSFGLSLVSLPLLALVLSVTGIGLQLTSVLAGVTLLVGLGGAVALGRRQRLPAADRFEPDLLELGRRLLDRRGTAVDSLLHIALVLAVVGTTTALVLGLAVPNGGDTYTDMAVLAENESGTLELDGYPRELTVGQPQELTLRVGNHEQTSVTYTVVVQLQRVRTNATTTTVQQRTTVTRLRQRVAPGERWQAEHTITPELTGTDLRLVYLLYKDEPPVRPTSGAADQTLHLWVNVSQ